MHDLGNVGTILLREDAMKLYYTPFPNYIHRVEIVAIEAGIYDDLELIPTIPWDIPKGLVEANPLGKVPTLIRDDGVPMFGGPIIYEYMDSFNKGPKMYPPEGNARWTALRLLGLGEVLFDICDLRQVEMRRRAKEEQSLTWIKRWAVKVDAGLDRLEIEVAAFSGFHIGLISIAGALLHFDFLCETRGNMENWRPGRPTLSAWYDAFIQRPSYERRFELHPPEPTPS
jgi:glutathione S-transferase